MTAKVILRELESKAATDRHGVYPTLLQMNTKKNYMFKTQVMEELVICDTADLRILIEERSEVLEDPISPFFVYTRPTTVTLEKTQTNATSVTMLHLRQAI